MVRRLLMALGGVLLLAGSAAAGNYYVASISVASTTAPVVALPPGQATASWVLCLRSTAAVAVLCWPYAGAPPVAVPGSAWEITPSSCRGDTANATVDSTMGAGWACVQETSGAAGTIDVLGR